MVKKLILGIIKLIDEGDYKQYYLTNEMGDFSLPKEAKIKVIIHRITNASIAGAEIITSDQILKLFGGQK